MHRTVMLLLAGALSAPGACLANPDGPLGSIVFQPHFKLGPEVVQLGSAAPGANVVPVHSVRTWRAGMGMLIPVRTFATLGLEYSRARAPLTDMQIWRGPEAGRFEALVSVREFNEVTVFARLYVPLDEGAQEALRRWDRSEP